MNRYNGILYPQASPLSGNPWGRWILLGQTTTMLFSPLFQLDKPVGQISGVNLKPEKTSTKICKVE